MNTQIRRRTAALLVGLVVLLAGACSSSSGGSKGGALPKGTIKFGALFTLSGPSGAIGTAQKKSFTVLFDRLNQAGGIAGRHVDLVSYNDKGDPSTAVPLAKKLSDEVSAIVYAGTSATSSQTIPVFMKNKVPVVALDGNDDYADPTHYPYMFPTYPSERQTAELIAARAAKLGDTKLGVVTDDLDYSRVVSSDLKKAAPKAGVKLVGPVTYSSTAIDVTTQLRQLRSKGAKAIALLSSVGLGHVYDGLRTIGWKVPIYTTSVAYFVGYTSLGDVSSTTVSNCVAPLTPGGKLPAQVDNTLKAVTAKTGVSPNSPSAVTYNDDLLILKSVIEKTKSVDPDKLRKAVESIKGQAFTNPNVEYSFSASNHNGFPAASQGICRMAPLGPYDYPIAAGGGA